MRITPLLDVGGFLAASGGKLWLGRAVSAMGMIAVMVVVCTVLVSATLMSGACAAYVMLRHEGFDAGHSLLMVMGLVIAAVTAGLAVMGLYLRRRLYRKPSGMAYFNQTIDAFLDGLLAKRGHS